MSTTTDDVIAWITFETCRDRKKNVIVSCVYRTPGSNIETFKDMMEEIFSQSNQKVMFICGVFNIDMLNPNKQNYW